MADLKDGDPITTTPQPILRYSLPQIVDGQTGNMERGNNFSVGRPFIAFESPEAEIDYIVHNATNIRTGQPIIEYSPLVLELFKPDLWLVIEIKFYGFIERPGDFPRCWYAKDRFFFVQVPYNGTIIPHISLSDTPIANAWYQNGHYAPDGEILGKIPMSIQYPVKVGETEYMEITMIDGALQNAKLNFGQIQFPAADDLGPYGDPFPRVGDFIQEPKDLGFANISDSFQAISASAATNFAPELPVPLILLGKQLTWNEATAGSIQVRIVELDTEEPNRSLFINRDFLDTSLNPPIFPPF